jgi:hypothetical protein
LQILHVDRFGFLCSCILSFKKLQDFFKIPLLQPTYRVDGFGCLFNEQLYRLCCWLVCPSATGVGHNKTVGQTFNEENIPEGYIHYKYKDKYLLIKNNL